MPRVLVIDDDQGVRELLVELLGEIGYDVTEADNGASGLDLVPHVHPDAVCLDLWMDGMPGLEVLDRLADDYPRLPVVIVTADPLIDTMHDALKRGASGYILKPFDLDHLRRVLAAALRGQRPVIK